MQASKALLYPSRFVRRISSTRLVAGPRIFAKAFPTASWAEGLAPSPVQSRSFHTTPPVSLPVRRRRRGDSGEAPTTERENPDTFEEHKPLTDPIEFEKKGQELLEKLGKAVEPMIAINDPFHVSRTSHMLKIALDRRMGSYEVELETDERVVVLRSPISGAHSYFYSNKIEQWVDTVDFHSLEGIFVRDLIRHCKGVPKL